MKHVIVIGDGLFGCVAAAAARARGHEVTLLGTRRPYAASRASGCVLAPSWLSSLSKDQVREGMALLRDLYTVHDVEFTTHLGLKFKAQRVDPDAVLKSAPRTEAQVLRVTPQGVVHVAGGTQHKADAVLVAAGVWSSELIEMPAIRGLYGASVRFKAHLPSPKIHVYAPYRQAVGFQLNSREVWFGDGTALIKKTWDAEASARVNATVERGWAMLGSEPVGNVTAGARPYVEGHKAGYFRKVHPRVWVSTGGAKNGTVLAAAQAAQFLKEVRL